MAGPIGNITSADAVYFLSFAGLYSTPFQIQSFSAGDMFSTDQVTSAEVVQGADGVMAAGWIPTLKMQRISLLASSPSVFIFDLVVTKQDQGRVVFTANGVITLRSTGVKYTLTNGVLSAHSVMPDAKSTLASRSYSITWQDITPAPV